MQSIQIRGAGFGLDLAELEQRIAATEVAQRVESARADLIAEERQQLEELRKGFSSSLSYNIIQAPSDLIFAQRALQLAGYSDEGAIRIINLAAETRMAEDKSFVYLGLPPREEVERALARVGGGYSDEEAKKISMIIEEASQRPDVSGAPGDLVPERK